MSAPIDLNEHIAEMSELTAPEFLGAIAGVLVEEAKQRGDYDSGLQIEINLNGDKVLLLVYVDQVEEEDKQLELSLVEDSKSVH